MQIKTILNRIQVHKGFVYGPASLHELAGRLMLELEIRPRKGSRPVCSGCGKVCPGYDTQAQRRFEFVPLWGIAVFFLYAMRRVNCPDCGVKIERIPWAKGKSHLTTTYAWFLAGWAKRLSWLELARAFHTSWENVFRSVRMAVEWGLAHRDLTNVLAIGADEICWRRRKDKFVTLVYQLDQGKRPSGDFSTGSGHRAVNTCGLFAAICGSPTCGSLRRKLLMRSTFLTVSISCPT